MEPDFGGVTFVEDSGGNGLFLLTAYARKFARRSYKILCLADDARMESFFKKILGHESLDVLRIDDDPLSWNEDEGDRATKGVLRNADNLIASIRKRLDEGDVGGRKTVLLLPCFSLIWLAFDHAETMRFLIRIRSSGAGKDLTSITSLPMIALIDGRLLTNSQSDQLKFISTAWASTSKAAEKDAITNESIICRSRVKYEQKKGAKINQKNLVVDITKAFDIVTAPKVENTIPKIDKPIIDRSSDPTAGLTFNLKLKDAEATAKQNVQLPHLVVRDSMRKQIRGEESTKSANSGGHVFYTPDEADDFDDEDPDADLDI